MFIVGLYDLSGKIPAYVFYESILSKFFTITKYSLKFSEFDPEAKHLFLIMINSGTNQVTLLKHMKQ